MCIRDRVGTGRRGKGKGGEERARGNGEGVPQPKQKSGCATASATVGSNEMTVTAEKPTFINASRRHCDKCDHEKTD